MTGQSTEPLLSLENVRVHYRLRRGMLGGLKRSRPHNVEAVAGVSLSVARGEMLALVGESGSGKTSTGQAALRLVPVAGGHVVFDGRDITDASTRDMRPLRAHMQAIYQDPYEALDPRFRVRHVLDQPLVVQRPGMSRAQRHAKRRAVLEIVGLRPPEEFLDLYPHELSGGQRQRVATAASLMLDPSLLIADEPVSMLDVSVRAELMTLLADLRERGLGILLITHDLATVANFADRIAVMYLGRIVEEGPAHAVVDSPRHPYTKALLSVVPRLDPRDRTRAEVLRGEIPDPTAVPAGCRFHPRCPMAEDRCRVVDPELRSVGAGEQRAACILA